MVEAALEFLRLNKGSGGLFETNNREALEQAKNFVMQQCPGVNITICQLRSKYHALWRTWRKEDLPGGGSIYRLGPDALKSIHRRQTVSISDRLSGRKAAISARNCVPIKHHRQLRARAIDYTEMSPMTDDSGR